MSVNYTSGQWTVSSNYNDTVTTAKTLSLPDLSYVTDFAKKDTQVDSASIINTTASGLVPSEAIKFGYSVVQNIYSNSDVDVSYISPSKRGVQVMAEITENYKAVNTVTGSEVVLPCKGRIVLRFPSMSCVSDALILDLFKRTISSALNTGLTDASRVIDLAKGSLLPPGL